MAATWRPVSFRILNASEVSSLSLSCHVNDDGGTWAVFGWTEWPGRRARLTRLWLGVGEPPDLDSFDPWDAGSSDSLSTAVIRSLNLTEAASQQTILQRESTRERQPLLSFNRVHRDWLDTDTAKELDFRSVTDLCAAVDRLEVAFLYVDLINQGNAKPAVAIAEQLGIPVQTVRARLQRARADDYLTSGEEGRASGELTQKARTLSKAITLAVEKRTGEWSTEEQREQIFQEKAAAEMEARQMDSYLDK